MDQIEKNRALVYKLFVESKIFKGVITPESIEKMFDLYDEVFFGNQMRNEILDGRSINFVTTLRRAGMSCFTYMDEEDFVIDISPNILETIERKYSRGLLLVQGKWSAEDKIEQLQFLMEHEIIHFLMLATGYGAIEKSGKDDIGDTIYGRHGKLFCCISKKFFGHLKCLHDLGIESIDDAPPPIISRVINSYSGIGVPEMGYEYWSNSCYLDSLVMGLFFNKSPYWKIGFLQLHESPEKEVDEDDKCIVEKASKIRDQIAKDIKSIIWQEKSVRCENLRMLLAECLPLKEGSGWQMFNVSEVYTALATAFPYLKIEYPVYRISRPYFLTYKESSIFSFWQFMEPEDEGEDKIRWDLIRSPVLAFYNTGAPRIKKMNRPGREKGYNIIDGTRYPFDVVKEKIFDEVILNIYELVCVVVLTGIREGKEGGTHYVCRFKGKGDKWYYYDDMKTAMVQEDLPDSVWEESGNMMPSMYFYSRK